MRQGFTLLDILKFVIAVIAILLVVTLAFGQDIAQTADDPDLFLSDEELQRIMEDVQKAPASQKIPDIQPAAGMPAGPSRALSGQKRDVNPITIPVQALPTVASGTVSASRSNMVGKVPEMPMQVAAPPTTEWAQLWQGTDRTRVDALLQRITEKGLQSPAARQLVVRLMVAEALPPLMSPRVPANQTPDFLAVRLQTLLALGHADEAVQLAKPVSPVQAVAEPLLGEMWVQTLLLTGDSATACPLVRQQVLNVDGVFWKRALITCQVLEKDAQGLALSLQLPAKTEQAENTLFYALAESIHTQGESPRLMPEARINPLEAVLYAADPRLITPDVVGRLPNSILSRVASSNVLGLSLRLQAAERLAADYPSAAHTASLATLYGTATFALELFKNAVANAKKEPDGSLARALLWQAALKAGGSTDRLQALTALWERAEADVLAPLGGLLTPDLREIQPQASLVWAAPRIIRNSLKADNLSVARAWWGVLKDAKSISAELQTERNRLGVLFAMVDNAVLPQTFTAWVDTLITAPEKTSARRTLAVLEASDLTIPSDIWLTLHNETGDAYTDQGKGPGPVWLRVLGSALDNQQVGNAALTALEPLLFAKPSDQAPIGLANIVSGLRYVGLSDTARQLAFEAILQ